MPKGEYDRTRAFSSDYARQDELVRIFKDMKSSNAQATALIKLQGIFRQPRIGRNIG